ncbi:hypothetical protein ACFSSA_09410 [Luteolibacter algae]|uniref:SHOCT domain-containing protein n=1 Tax=Luteolibacter algae TaxID=454151 RepID=A0ABW5D8Z8_9BACT
MLALSCSALTTSPGQQPPEALHQVHAQRLAVFEADTRTELTRIARDKTIPGEEKIVRIEQWFADNATRIDEINHLADTLDRTQPLARPVRPARPADPSPEGIAAASLHTLSRRFSKGEITPAEFHSLRASLLDTLNTKADAEKRNKHTPARPVALPPLPGPDATPEQLAKALHVHNRHLSTLPPEEAAAIRANPQSPVNLLPALIQTKLFTERIGQPLETSSKPQTPTR